MARDGRSYARWRAEAKGGGLPPAAVRHDLLDDQDAPISAAAVALPEVLVGDEGIEGAPDAGEHVRRGERAQGAAEILGEGAADKVRLEGALRPVEADEPALGLGVSNVGRAGHEE